jgi:BMFP domain-containing protein YqiC
MSDWNRIRSTQEYYEAKREVENLVDDKTVRIREKLADLEQRVIALERDASKQ